MSIITINGTEYKAKPFTFNLMCDFEDSGITMSEINSKTMSFTRAYLATCMRMGKKDAGEEFEKHLASGGTFDDVLNVISDEMEKSDFFRNIGKSTEQENIKMEKKEK